MCYNTSRKFLILLTIMCYRSYQMQRYSSAPASGMWGPHKDPFYLFQFIKRSHKDPDSKYQHGLKQTHRIPKSSTDANARSRNGRKAKKSTILVKKEKFSLALLIRSWKRGSKIGSLVEDKDRTEEVGVLEALGSDEEHFKLSTNHPYSLSRDLRWRRRRRKKDNLFIAGGERLLKKQERKEMMGRESRSSAWSEMVPGHTGGNGRLPSSCAYLKATSCHVPSFFPRRPSHVGRCPLVEASHGAGRASHQCELWTSIARTDSWAGNDAAPCSSPF